MMRFHGAAGIALLLSLSGCVIAVGGAGDADRHASRPAETRRLDVAAFDTIVLESADDVTIVPGTDRMAVATGDPRAIATLAIEVRGGVLSIGRVPGTHRDRGAVIMIATPMLRAVTIEGSGDVDAGEIVAPSFAGRVTGSGTLRIGSLRVDAAQIDAEGSGDAIVRGIAANRVMLGLRGSGDIVADGAADRVVVSAGGSGDVDSSRLTTPALSVTQSGSGNVRAHASGRADGSATGSGNVIVSGGGRCTIARGGSATVSCR